jgi:hypothetical protein
MLYLLFEYIFGTEFMFVHNFLKFNREIHSLFLLKNSLAYSMLYMFLK